MITVCFCQNTQSTENRLKGRLESTYKVLQDSTLNRIAVNMVFKA
jgi:hypothetical protein